jgi:hypothetical protein
MTSGALAISPNSAKDGATSVALPIVFITVHLSLPLLIAGD